MKYTYRYEHVNMFSNTCIHLPDAAVVEYDGRSMKIYFPVKITKKCGTNTATRGRFVEIRSSRSNRIPVERLIVRV